MRRIWEPATHKRVKTDKPCKEQRYLTHDRGMNICRGRLKDTNKSDGKKLNKLLLLLTIIHIYDLICRHKKTNSEYTE